MVASYEEIRRQRVEENKKRMEALHLPMLAQALHNSSSSVKKKAVKPRNTVKKQPIVVRKSGRIANNPPPVYKEIDTADRLIKPKRYSSGRRDLSNRVYASDEARRDAIDRAEELQSGLTTEYPSVVKPMLQSHVTGGFWLGLPRSFCKKNLPMQDDIVTMINEDGDEYRTIYLVNKNGLSGGWRGFAMDHDLVDGDVVVFQLIRPLTLKAYIVRGNKSKPSQDA